MLVKGVELDRRLVHSRKVPRKVVDWSGTYITEHREGAVWQKCSVVDISVLGVGLELFGAVPSDLMGHRVAVEVQTPMGACAVWDRRSPTAAYGWDWSSVAYLRLRNRLWTRWRQCRWSGNGARPASSAPRKARATHGMAQRLGIRSLAVPKHLRTESETFRMVAHDGREAWL
jgi:hypothetical protein